MFENLTDRLSDAFRKLTGRGVLSESDVIQAMRQVRRALLEADVNFKVAKEFVSDVSLKATGESVLKSLAPGKQVIKIVNDEIVKLLGTDRSTLQLSGTPPPGLSPDRSSGFGQDHSGSQTRLVACGKER